MLNQLIKIVFLSMFVVVCSLATDYTDLPNQTIVLANANMPESVELAHYYMQRRNIPDHHLCLLHLPQKEIITRYEYETQLKPQLLSFLVNGVFVVRDESDVHPAVRTGFAPIDKLLQKCKWLDEDTTKACEWDSVNIKYLVLIYGVPLKIEDSPIQKVRGHQDMSHGVALQGRASLDSELCMLLYPSATEKGPRTNPLYSTHDWGDPDMASKWFLITSRLDGPNPGLVKMMIDNTLLGEKYGMQGQAFFDARGLSRGAYYEGDYWIREAYERFLREGYESELDMQPVVWGSSFPMDQVVVYMGWYAEHVTGPFIEPEFQFNPGAVAYHLHSGSASSIRTSSEHWVGPFISKGASSTMGAVYEPYLGFTPHLDIFTSRLCDGYTLGESAWMSMNNVSWQITVIGDPLYRPFKYDLDLQIQHLEADQRPEVQWAYIRKMNLLLRRGRLKDALEYGLSRQEHCPGLALKKKIANTLALNGEHERAERFYLDVIEKADDPKTTLRCGVRLLQLHRNLGAESEFQKLYDKLKKEWGSSPYWVWLDAMVQ